MISFLIGEIKAKGEKSVTILTPGGVGYKVFMPINSLLSLNEKEKVEIIIHTVVKDDAIDLYGFIENEEKEVFEKLITVSGVGPKSALNILSVSSVENIASAVEGGNATSLSNIPGLGKKSAEKVVIELKGKLSHLLKEKFVTGYEKEEDDARLALLSLGYNEKNINEALSNIKKNSKEDLSSMGTGTLIKEALKYLR
jgi:Holliday junction DNA helicase RuvA